jgi:hypothetical protein
MVYLLLDYVDLPFMVFILYNRIDEVTISHTIDRKALTLKNLNDGYSTDVLVRMRISLH